MDFDKNLSFIQLSDKLVASVRQIMQHAKSEEDLRIGFEKILDPVLSNIGVKSAPRYERLSQQVDTIYKGRPDAVHGMVIIEYEPPRSFNSISAVEHAHDQLVNYICAEASVRKDKLFLEDPKFVGVGFDGEQIFFTKYQGDKTTLKNEFKKSDFIYQGPYPFDNQTARTFLTYMRSLSRRPLIAEYLAESFGPEGNIAPIAVKAFADALEYWGSERVRVFFNEWKRLFGIVYGEQFTLSQKTEAEALSNLYKVGKETDFQELLFSVHTYFAFLMKLITAELITLKDTQFTSSYSEQLTHTSTDVLKNHLTDIENGGIYAKRGISNFLEGDFFRWYLDAWSSPQLQEAIREITRELSEFEPATSIIQPETTRDLLKKLYQYLVPQEVRHKLGEYYTPDWLAELLISEVGYDGNTLKRFLDPACGSGTFLVFAIQRARTYGQKNHKPKLETAKRILANIWGFDLNPLAIIAARTNYLFALGDLVDDLNFIEIPIYLADSVLWPERAGNMQLHITDVVGGEYVRVQTSVKQFHVPAIWLNDSGFNMRRAAPIVEELVKQSYKTLDAMNRLKKEGLSFPPHDKVVQSFYEELLELENHGKNGIWARFLKNVFAPMMTEKFDFVIGNPPWIMWDFLSQEYRDATKELWKNYGLFSLSGFGGWLSGSKKDFSMLFTYASADYYLKDKGKLGFLITRDVLKSGTRAEGFRRFKLGEKEYLKILKAHDLVSIQPFEGATNKTAAIILKKGEKTEYPLPYIVWSKKKGVGRIATDKLLDNVLPLLNKSVLTAKPIGSNVGAWQTLTPEDNKLTCIEGKNNYKATAGAFASPYGVFWLKIEQILSNKDVLIQNLPEKGKVKVSSVKYKIENDLIYPALRGSDIKRWGFDQEIFLLMTQDPKTRKPFPRTVMQENWPQTYGYLLQFKDIIPKYGSKAKKKLAERTEFYALFNIGEETVSRYKVVWKAMTNDIHATVISSIKVLEGYKNLIPLHTASFFPTSDESEAHYLCAIINSGPVRTFIKSFASAGRGFGTPSVMKEVGIPKFDPDNPLHNKLSGMSKQLHELKKTGNEVDIPKLEAQNDLLVKELFEIN